MLKNNKKIKNNLHKFKGHMIFLSIIVVLFLIVNCIMQITTDSNLIYLISKKIMGDNAYTNIVRSVEINSSNDDEPGSWDIEKSAEWTGYGKAKVTFNVDTVMKTEDRDKDVILVIDISGSMDGNKLGKVKEDSIELVKALLSNDNNRVALITFDTTSRIVSEFTDNQDEIINEINSLDAYGTTNYNQALENVNNIMSDYIKKEDKDVVTLFLTDGYPTTSNQAATYKILKDKYPYMGINGIQYEMGKDIIQEIKEISDNQWIASQETLDNVLFEAAVSPFVYEKYEIVDYIDKDYFILDDEKDIKVSTGTYVIEHEDGYEKIIWTLDPFITGKEATMDINLLLKEEYKEKGGYYSTNEREEITYKLPGEDEKRVTSEETPVLKNQYEIKYETNAPTGCNLNDFTEKHYVYEKVEKSDTIPSCKGYSFKGWEIVTENVKKINDDVFEMPAYDVTIRATWTKPSIEKGMSGTVWEDKTAAKMIRNLYNENDDSSIFKDSEENIRYRGANPNNHVIFNGESWRIIGVIDGKLKIIRDESIGSYVWEVSSHVFDGGNDLNEWDQSDLMKMMNPGYETESLDGYRLGSQYWYGENGYGLIVSGGYVYVNPSNYDGLNGNQKGLSAAARNMISESTWYWGSTGLNFLQTISFNNMQDLITVEKKSSWEGYVGLMSISDYGYAAGKSCSSTLDQYNNCGSENWLFYEGEWQWLLNPDSDLPSGFTNPPYIWIIGDTGVVGASVSYTSILLARPTVYLNPNVKIIAGDGTEGDPYQLLL